MRFWEFIKKFKAKTVGNIMILVYYLLVFVFLFIILFNKHYLIAFYFFMAISPIIFAPIVYVKLKDLAERVNRNEKKAMNIRDFVISAYISGFSVSMVVLLILQLYYIIFFYIVSLSPLILVHIYKEEYNDFVARIKKEEKEEKEEKDKNIK